MTGNTGAVDNPESLIEQVKDIILILKETGKSMCENE